MLKNRNLALESDIFLNFTFLFASRSLVLNGNFGRFGKIPYLCALFVSGDNVFRPYSGISVSCP